MHIRKVVISGFKSFESPPSEDLEFSEEINFIVGLNGSGKSNFFDAIRFVLSEGLSRLRTDDRKQLLFDSRKPTVSAWVRLHIDNSDGRLPIAKDEVVIKRAIGLNKDVYYLDNKHVTKQEIISLLESAGFSRSNPYYIVPQGRVQSLTTMSDKERLNLLKEVAGTRVYEEKRRESQSLIAEAASRRQKVEEVLTHIEERLEELEGEKNELNKYQKLDKLKRILEYSIHERGVRDATEKLEEIDRQRSERWLRAQEVLDLEDRVAAEISELRRELEVCEGKLSHLNAERKALANERTALIERKARLELRTADDEEAVGTAEDTHQNKAVELQRTTEEIERIQAQIEDKRKTLDEQLARERDLTERLAQVQFRLNALYQKGGRSAKFSSQRERDAAFEREIEEIHIIEERKSTQLQQEMKDMDDALRHLEKLQKDEAEKEKSLEKRRTISERAAKEQQELLKRRNELATERKRLWQMESDYEAQIAEGNTELQRAERGLQSSLDKAISMGLQHVNAIVREHRIEGVYGPLIELLECERAFMRAAQVTAGNALFHIVVDTERTAARLLTLMSQNQHRGGRVTFMPLSRLRRNSSELPVSPEAVPLISRLKFHSMFRPAVDQVFGRTLVCRNLIVGTEMSRSHGLNCVTLEGYQVNKQGALSGGYVDERTSRLGCMEKIKEWKAKLHELCDKRDKLKSQISQVDQEVSQVLGEMEMQQGKVQQCSNVMEQWTIDIRALKREAALVQSSIDARKKSIADLEMSVRQSQAEIQNLQREMGTPLNSQLDESETEEMAQFSEEAASLKKQLADCTSTRAEAEMEKSRLDFQLSDNLLRKQGELMAKVAELKLGDIRSRLDNDSSELESVTASIRDVDARASLLDSEVEGHRERARQMSLQLDEKRAVQYEQRKEVATQSKSMERLLNKRSVYKQQLDECERQIRDLGSLPADAYEKYQDTQLEQLHQKLTQVNGKLKRYSHVNKKALDQFATFSNQRERMAEKKRELDVSDEAINELISTLDQKKDEAIERTYRGVAKEFKDVFRELVPSGDAELVMRFTEDEDEDEDSDVDEADEDDHQRTKKRRLPDGQESGMEAVRMRTYTGIKIRASFRGGEKLLSLEQLSGGQKSLVALSLIFAIQRCDPAPFYLFDEIDRALDPAHRIAVAEMLRRQNASGSKTQFIVCTHKDEMMRQNYGQAKYFRFRMNYASDGRALTTVMSTVDKEEALGVLLEREQQDREAEGGAVHRRGKQSTIMHDDDDRSSVASLTPSFSSIDIGSRV